MLNLRVMTIERSKFVSSGSKAHDNAALRFFSQIQRDSVDVNISWMRLTRCYKLTNKFFHLARLKDCRAIRICRFQDIGGWKIGVTASGRIDGHHDLQVLDRASVEISTAGRISR